MKKCKNHDTCPCECEFDEMREKCAPDLSERIYHALDVAEKIAVKLAQINQIIKKSNKKKKKKNKKLGKIDKKTGTLILKKEKRQKKQKLQKRHKDKK